MLSCHTNDRVFESQTSETESGDQKPNGVLSGIGPDSASLANKVLVRNNVMSFISQTHFRSTDLKCNSISAIHID